MPSRTLRTYQVTLSESRRLTAYLDAASLGEAVEQTMRAWHQANADPARQLPFAVDAAELARPAAARRVTRAG